MRRSLPRGPVQECQPSKTYSIPISITGAVSINMIRLSTALIFVVASIQPQVTAGAEADRSDSPPASYSCFQRPDHCLKQFATTRDRDNYDLCLLSDRVCRDYQYNWKLMRSRLKNASGVLNDCFPDRHPASQ